MSPNAPSSAPKTREGLRVLVIDDDEELCQLTADYLAPLGFHVEAAHTGESGAERALTEPWHAVILDVMLPDVDGFDVLRRVRAKSKTPVIMLTGRGDEVDRVVGLELGADDYLPKTFSSRELLARLRSVVRRAGWVTESALPAPVRQVVAGPLRICPETHTASLDDKALTLTRTEFDLLLALARAKGRVKSATSSSRSCTAASGTSSTAPSICTSPCSAKSSATTRRNPALSRPCAASATCWSSRKTDRMGLRVPLYGKVLFWFFVNLALVAALAAVFAQMQFRLGLDWLLAGPARQRLEAMGEIVAAELRDQPIAAWDRTLARFQAANGASFTIFRNDGLQAAGEPLKPPPPCWRNCAIAAALPISASDGAARRGPAPARASRREPTTRSQPASGARAIHGANGKSGALLGGAPHRRDPSRAAGRPARHAAHHVRSHHRRRPLL